MSLARQSTAHRVPQVLPAGPASRPACAFGLALLACALLGAPAPAHATLKVVPEGKKGASVSPAPPAAREPAAREPAPKESAPKESAPKEPASKEPASREPVAKDPPSRDLAGKDPGAREPVARETGPKESSKDQGRRDPVARDSGGKEAERREPATAPRARPSPEPARAACSDELDALSLGTLGPEDIERLRSKGCLPAIAAPK